MPSDEDDLEALDKAFEVEEERTDLDKIFERFLDPKNIHHVTELSESQIVAITTLYNISSEYDITFLQKWLGDYLKFQVSKGRKGRAEWVKVASRNQEQEPQGGGRFGFNNFFRGN